MDKLVTTSAERFWSPEAFARDQFIKSHAQKLAPGSRVLDAGAGASKYRSFFTHCKYETQDFCQYRGHLVQYLQPIDHVCDIVRIPLQSESLDAVVCTEVLEHVLDPMAVLDEFARLLRPGGKLFLTAPFLSHLHMDPFHYYSGFTRYWYDHWLPLKGFSLDSIVAIGGSGRSTVVFSQAFYAEWARAERELFGWRRFASLVFRALAKPFVHFILPYSLPKFDSWLGPRLVCSTYLVEATRDKSRSVGVELASAT
jgi:SAM-dependent methyltransferase